MHPMWESVLGSDNESISDLQEVLCVEGHLLAQPPRRVNPCDLNKLSVDILSDDPIHLLSAGEEVARGIQRVSKWGETLSESRPNLEVLRPQ